MRSPRSPLPLRHRPGRSRALRGGSAGTAPAPSRRPLPSPSRRAAPHGSALSAGARPPPPPPPGRSFQRRRHGRRRAPLSPRGPGPAAAAAPRHGAGQGGKCGARGPGARHLGGGGARRPGRCLGTGLRAAEPPRTGGPRGKIGRAQGLGGGRRQGRAPPPPVTGGLIPGRARQPPALRRPGRAWRPPAPCIALSPAASRSRAPRAPASPRPLLLSQPLRPLGAAPARA